MFMHMKIIYNTLSLSCFLNVIECSIHLGMPCYKMALNSKEIGL